MGSGRRGSATAASHARERARTASGEEEEEEVEIGRQRSRSGSGPQRDRQRSKAQGAGGQAVVSPFSPLAAALPVRRARCCPGEFTSRGSAAGPPATFAAAPGGEIKVRQQSMWCVWTLLACCLLMRDKTFEIIHGPECAT